MKFFRTRWIAPLCVALLAACAREQPDAPQPVFTITGQLLMTGSVVGTDARYQGIRVLRPDGIPVELLHGSQVVARTTTTGGSYRFAGLRAGDYVARSRVIGNLGDQTSPLILAVADIEAADTLRLMSRGDLFPVPNPRVDTTQIFFSVPDTTFVDINVQDVSGRRVKNLLTLDVSPRRQGVFWNGRDTQGRIVTDSLYWVTFVSAHDSRIHLLFKRSP
ncbi:MAG TPA: hypothetical protein VJY35_13485 [Candidatus Eisenbacteria bacterium]|nr:hypothetical protein [Candidatus Eisenbacteria bacterium]